MSTVQEDTKEDSNDNHSVNIKNEEWLFDGVYLVNPPAQKAFSY